MSIGQEQLFSSLRFYPSSPLLPAVLSETNVVLIFNLPIVVTALVVRRGIGLAMSFWGLQQGFKYLIYLKLILNVPLFFPFI